MYHMLLQVLAVPCSPHDGVFVECVDVKTIESEVQLLKGSDIHCRQLKNSFQNG